MTLFSKLSSEHVVRYIHSWVETTTVESPETTTTEATTSTSSGPVVFKGGNHDDDDSLLPDKLKHLEVAGLTHAAAPSTRSTSSSSSTSTSSSSGSESEDEEHRLKEAPIPRANFKPPAATAIMSTAFSGSDLSVVFAAEGNVDPTALSGSDSHEHGTQKQTPKPSFLFLVSWHSS